MCIRLTMPWETRAKHPIYICQRIGHDREVSSPIGQVRTVRWKPTLFLQGHQARAKLGQWPFHDIQAGERARFVQGRKTPRLHQQPLNPNMKTTVTGIIVSHLWGAVQHCHRNSNCLSPRLPAAPVSAILCFSSPVIRSISVEWPEFALPSLRPHSFTFHLRGYPCHLKHCAMLPSCC